MNGLKACPFCPNGTKYVELETSQRMIEWEEYRAHVVCNACGALGPMRFGRTEIEAAGMAAAAWNSRHERTCNPLDESHAYVHTDGNGILLIRRACDCGSPLFYDRMGLYSGERMEHTLNKPKFFPKYCDECGTKFIHGKSWWPPHGTKKRIISSATNSGADSGIIAAERV